MANNNSVFIYVVSYQKMTFRIQMVELKIIFYDTNKCFPFYFSRYDR